MRCFLGKITVGLLLLMPMFMGVVAWRCYRLEQLARVRLNLDENCRVLVLGDSHADSAFVEDKKLGIRIAGRHSSPMNVTLMRLKEIERRGALRSVRFCVVNLCHTSVMPWTYEQQKEAVWNFLPYALRYKEWIPVSGLRLFLLLADQTLHYPEITPELVCTPADYSPRPSILERSKQEVQSDLSVCLKRHFSWDSKTDDIIPNWRESMKTVIGEMKNVCDRNGTKLVFFSAPLSQAYRANIPEWAKDNLNGWVAFAHSLSIPYFDYSSACGDDMLRDCNHIRLQCAPEFSARFCREALKWNGVEGGE